MADTRTFHAPTHAPAAPSKAEEHYSFLRPAGAGDVRQRDLMRELLRWPTILLLPISVAVLTAVGLHHPLAAIPCGVMLATIATVTAARRACSRVVMQAAVTSLVPAPRTGIER